MNCLLKLYYFFKRITKKPYHYAEPQGVCLSRPLPPLKKEKESF